MKIFTEGGRAPQCQVNRIDDGFRELGHELIDNPSDADLVYSNNFWYPHDLLELKRNGKIKGKLILNVLDIPLHIIEQIDIERLKSELLLADSVTSISEYTKNSLKQWTGFDSDIIYQPIMPVFKTEEREKSLYRFTFIGRKSDVNKRVGIGVHALWILGIKSEEVAMIGNEPIQWGVHLGQVKTNILNKIYNETDFVMCLGKVEGLNLPVIEAMATGSIPVVCNDLTTRYELLPPDLFPEYDAVSPSPSSVAMFISQFLQDNTAKEDFKKRLYQHYQDNLKDKFTSRSVAARITSVYEGL